MRNAGDEYGTATRTQETQTGKTDNTPATIIADTATRRMEREQTPATGKRFEATWRKTTEVFGDQKSFDGVIQKSKSVPRRSKQGSLNF